LVPGGTFSGSIEPPRKNAKIQWHDSTGGIRDRAGNAFRRRNRAGKLLSVGAIFGWAAFRILAKPKIVFAGYYAAKTIFLPHPECNFVPGFPLPVLDTNAPGLDA
jgi:hypothetical protein